MMNRLGCVGPKAQFRQMYSIQKKIIRAITFSPPLSRSESLFRSLGFLNIHEINDLICVFVFRCMNQDRHPCDHSLSSMYYVGNYYTRYNNAIW